MGKRHPKYMELKAFESFKDNPFVDTTGLADAFIRPKEMLLKPVYGGDGLPRKVNADGKDVMVGQAYFGKGETLDRRQYVKLFVEFLPLILSSDLGAAGIKMLIYVLTRLKTGADSVVFNTKLAAARIGYKAESTAMEGIVDLIKMGVLAKREDTTEEYWINHQFIFRGDRVKMLDKRKDG